MNPLILISTLLPALIQIAPTLVQQFPQLASLITAIEGGMTHPAQQQNVVSFVQELLNAAQAAGLIAFGAPLKVDGLFGPATFAAIQVAQKALAQPLDFTTLKALFAKLQAT